MTVGITSQRFSVLSIVFLLTSKLCAAEASRGSDELNPTKVVPNLVWQKLGSDDKATFCSLDISDDKGVEIKNLKIAAPVFEARIINPQQGEGLETYFAKLRALGFDMNRVKYPGSVYYLGSNLSDGACGGTYGYVRIRNGNAQIVCVDNHIFPCSGAEDDDESTQKVTSTYSVVVSNELSISEVLSDIGSKNNLGTRSKNKK